MADNFADATELTLGVEISEDNTGYTNEVGEAIPYGGFTAWFKFTPTNSAPLVVDTESTVDVDAYVEVYTGSTLATLTWVTEAWLGSPATFTPVLGTTYYLQTDSDVEGEVFIRIAGGPIVLALAGISTLAIGSEFVTTTPELQVTILDPVIEKAPSAITVMVGGGQPNTEAVIDIDGTDVLTVTLDTDGGLGATTVGVTEALGAVGSHTVTVTQDILSGATIDGSATFTVLFAPGDFPTDPDPDDDPTEDPGAIVPGTDVRRWVLQDFAPGGLGSYVLPINPRKMTSPHWEKSLTSRRTTAKTGQFHISQAAGIAKPWTFSGYTSSQVMVEKLQAYGALNRRFYVIDHRNRAWQVVFTHVQVVPRKQQNVNGVYTDWGTDFTVNAVILDQVPVTPA